MSVIVFYTLDFVKNLDLSQGPATAHPKATSLAGGGFAVSGDVGVNTALEVFNPSGFSLGGTAVIERLGSAIDQLSNGNILILSASNNDSQILSLTAPDGGFIDSRVFNSRGSGDHDVAALPGGGFWFVFDFISMFSFEREIIVSFGNNAGTFVGGFGATTVIGGDANNPAAVALDNGNVILAWKNATSDITYAVYDAFGGVISTPAPAGTADAGSALALTSTAKGFALAYTDSAWGTGGSDITLKQFRFDGTLLMTSNVSNPSLSTSSAKEAEPALARLSNDFLGVAYKLTVPPVMRTDPTVIDTVAILVDPATGTPLAGKNVLGGGAATDEVGTPATAGFANGSLAVFHRNITGNDIAGEHLQATRTSTGDAARNNFTGDSLRDVMNGGGGKDHLRGLRGPDSLDGGPDDDIVEGGRGCDTMTGGRGSDIFVYKSTGDSPAGATCDLITDFVHRTDKIDLSAIDARINTLGNNAFSFRGTLAFTSEGQVRAVQSGLNTIVEINTKGATGAEMTIHLDKVTASSLSLIDFFF